jgi:cyanophycin synthetase
VLETDGPLASDPQAHRRWRDAAQSMSIALGWPEQEPVLRLHASGALLALRAPLDELMMATEVNEWAWELAVGLIGEPPFAPGYNGCDALHARYANFAAALDHFRAAAAREQKPVLRALVKEANARELPLLLDDELLSIGSGGGSQSWPVAAMPGP